MPVAIRRAVTADAALLAEHRAAVWRETSHWGAAELAEQTDIWAAFFREHVADETYVAFIAEHDGVAVGSGGLLIYLAIPRPGLDSDRAGRVQSVYVVPVSRRQGVARSLMESILAFARETALISLVLRPSAQALSLYTQLGFESSGELQLRFTRG